MGASNVYATPWGPILIREDKGRICLVAVSPTPEEDDKRPSTLTNARTSSLNTWQESDGYSMCHLPSTEQDSSRRSGKQCRLFPTVRYAPVPISPAP